MKHLRRTARSWLVLLAVAAAAGAPTDGDAPLLGIVRGHLTRLDPLTLEPLGRAFAIGEYHHAWSFSPDRSRLAIAISAPGA